MEILTTDADHYQIAASRMQSGVPNIEANSRITLIIVLCGHMFIGIWIALWYENPVSTAFYELTICTTEIFWILLVPILAFPLASPAVLSRSYARALGRR